MLSRLSRPPIEAAARHRQRRLLRGSLAAAAAFALALLSAGCGASAPKVASLGSDTIPGQSSQGGTPAGGGSSGAPGGAPAGGGAVSHASIKIDGASAASALAFAKCVRAHGVPDFPDPTAAGVFNFNGDITQSPQFRSASQTCRSVAHIAGGPPSPAQQAKMLASLLKYSGCMRSHGVPNFPDPTSSPGGAVGLAINSSMGIDPNSAIFQRAQQACQSLAPGGGP
jgi:hypothetical protein